MAVLADGRMTCTSGRIARLTLTAPDRRNAISQAMWAALPPLCARIAADDTVRAVILSATGPVFSAGADIGEFAQVHAAAASRAAYNALVRAGQAALAALPQPVLAAVAAPCVGGWCRLALSSHLILAGPAAQFGITPARLGLAYGRKDTARLVARVGPGRAKDMLCSGRLVPADEALAIGLTDRVADDPLAAAQDYAVALAGLSPVAIRAAKTTINALTTPGHPDESTARAAITAAFASANFAEGKAAFAQRRKPVF